MAVGQGLLGGEQIVRRDQGLVAQQATEGLDFLRGPGGKVGQGALTGFVAFAPAFAEEDGGRGVAVGDDGDVHANMTPQLSSPVKHKYVYHMGTFPQAQTWLASKRIKDLSQNLG